MNVSAVKETVEQLPPRETTVLVNPTVEKIDRITAVAGDINFHSAWVEIIRPYGNGMSV